MSLAPVVRVRFLVALIIVFGVLASAAGAVAVERARDAETLRALVAAQDVVQRTDWPEGLVQVKEGGGCRSAARAWCLKSDRPARETALTVADALGLPDGAVRERTEPAGLYEARGAIGLQDVVVLVQPLDRSGGIDPDGAHSAVDIELHDGQDVGSDAEWRASSRPVD